jgi:uncharacterized RDD family membrane protein YckC
MSGTSAKVEQRTAGIVSRGAAAVIDFLVVGMLLTAFYLGLVLTRLMFHSTAFTLPTLDAIFSASFAFVVSIVYLVGCWSVSGSTVGAVVMGLRVVSRRGPRVGAVVALIRALTCVLFPFGLLWVVLDRHRRSLQDIVCRTRVVYSRVVVAHSATTRSDRA